MKNLISKLASLSSELDGRGFTSESAQIDRMLEKLAAQPVPGFVFAGQVIRTAGDLVKVLGSNQNLTKQMLADISRSPKLAGDQFVKYLASQQGAASILYSPADLAKVLVQKGMLNPDVPQQSLIQQGLASAKEWFDKHFGGVTPPTLQELLGVSVVPDPNFSGGTGSISNK